MMRRFLVRRPVHAPEGRGEALSRHADALPPEPPGADPIEAQEAAQVRADVAELKVLLMVILTADDGQKGVEA